MGLLVCDILRQVCTMTKFCRHRCHVHCYNAIIALLPAIALFAFSFFFPFFLSVSLSGFNHLESITSIYLGRRTFRSVLYGFSEYLILETC